MYNATASEWQNRVINVADIDTDYTTTNSTTTFTSTDLGKVHLVDTTSGSIVLTLPDASTVDGKWITFKKTSDDTNYVTVDSDGGTISGTDELYFNQQQTVYKIGSDGTNWHVLSSV
jgi:hypothetical protein